MKTTMTSDRAARLAELEFIALCKQHQAAKQQAVGVKNPRRTKPDFYSHYLRPVQGQHKRQGISEYRRPHNRRPKAA